MMKPVIRIDGTSADAVLGTPELDPGKALWNGGMLLAVLIFAVPTFSWSALALFVGTTYVSLLIGHSVGMHRMMIHRSFDCARPVERLLIYLGVLVGVAGPFGIMRIHDLRDWAQRQPACHDFFAHCRTLLPDLWWQLTSRFAFVHPPRFSVEQHYADDVFYRFLEKTWR